MFNPIYAVAYTRYSSDNQRDESITGQLRAIEEYCKQKGYTLLANYSDEAKSATTDQRPNFQRMISDAKTRKFDVVVVHKLDRFSRDRYDSAFYKRELKVCNVRLESVLEQFDNSPETIILESVLEAMAEYYSKNLAREVMKGMKETAYQGKHAGGRPPYGYKINPTTRTLEIDEERAGAVRIYFEGIAKGISLNKIADKINELGYRTYSGKPFTKNSFCDWARNRKYAGDYTWNVAISKSEGTGKRNNHLKKPIDKQIIISNAIPAIVTPELWDKVSSLMHKRKRQGGSLTAKQVYLFSGLIKCDKCGHVYEGSSYLSKGKRFTYYKCSNKCGNGSIKKDVIEDLIVDEILNQCFAPNQIDEMVQQVKILYQQQRSRKLTEDAPLRTKLASLESKINNWIEALGSGIKGLEEKIKHAQNRIEEIQAKLTEIEIMDRTLTIDEAMIRKQIERNKRRFKESDAYVRKQAMQDYIQSISFLSTKKNKFIVNLKVRCFNGGGEGSRTPVRRQRHIGFYGCSDRFDVTLETPRHRIPFGSA